ncbi:uncharacterized protein VNE69_01027 [Vairimorpha necatrix]|uniref:Uncharacterized protein n=1 Tax=Vairimorpha necatrix TaxID=6039 RepID=A0AAX4J801_9MICR
MDKFIPIADKPLDINIKNIISNILTNINQNMNNIDELLENLKILIYSTVDPNELKNILHILTLKLEEDTSSLDVEMLEIVCILYLKNINFNLEYFLKKTKINEKHNVKISLCKEVEFYKLDSLANLLRNSNFSMSIDINFLRIFIVECLLEVDKPLVDSDVFYFLKYIITFDPQLIVHWITKKPKCTNWEIIKIKNTGTFPFIELRYIKNLSILRQISCNSINYRFIDYLIKHLKFSEDFYKMIVQSHDKTNYLYTIEICKFIRYKSYEFHTILIKNLMMVDKINFNEYFINSLQNKDVLDPITEDVIDTFKINYKLLNLCDNTLLNKIQRYSNLDRLINNTKAFKYFLRILYDKKILDIKLIAKFFNNPKILIFLYKNFKIPKEVFYDQIIRILARLIKEWKDLIRLKDKMKKKIIQQNCSITDEKNCNTTIKKYQQNCDSTLKDISLLDINHSNIFRTSNSTICYCFKKKMKHAMKLLFIYNNPDVPKTTIFSLYRINKKMFIRYFTRYVELNLLFIKIHKMFPYLRQDHQLNVPQDYWGKAVIHKITNNYDILPEGLYFNNSYLEFKNTSKSFTLNMLMLQYDLLGNQNYIILKNNQDKFVLGINNGRLYYKTLINNIRTYKDINHEFKVNNTIYFEIIVDKGVISLLIEGRKYFLNIFTVTDIIIGQGFKGIITKLLYFESSKYKKSRIVHLDKSELYINIIKKIEMWCVSRSLGGMFLRSKKVYWWHKKPIVKFNNIIDIT